jgi:hypothetical protein
MQLAEALSPEETQALGRFAKTEDGHKAIEAKFQVVSLKQVLAGGGRLKEIPEAARMPWDEDDEDISSVIRRGGRVRVKKTAVILPRLAVAPSRSREIVYRYTPGSLNFEVGEKWHLTVPSEWKGDFGQSSFRARTPLLPVEARRVVEDYRFSLVLWEADWQPVPVPMGDPAILVPVLGDFYAVAHVWDLTELEKQVLQKAFV